MIKVSKRGGFSDRNAIKPENTTIQLKDFDKRTRIQLQNMLSMLYAKVYNDRLHYSNDNIQCFLKYVMAEIFSESVDSRKIYDDDYIIPRIYKVIEQNEYDDVLTLIEAVVQYWDEFLKKEYPYEYYDEYRKAYIQESVFEEVNQVFKKEYIGYRFIGGYITAISDDIEVNEINKAINNKQFDPVSEHIAKAIKYLSDREKPDYENSIKESISAVEALCEIFTGLRGSEATLGKMLKRLEDNGIKIHGGLKSAFNVLYGYTSDANGIRHAGDIGGKASTFEEAKFMLVSCSAFINYLIAVNAD